MTLPMFMKMLEYASIAYEDNQPICKDDCYTAIKEPYTDTECYVRHKQDDVLISFRGSDSKINWLSNFYFCKGVIPYGNSKSHIRVHRGFLNTYKSVREQIHALIPSKSCCVRITGHSLGAALAVLCAVDIQYNFPHKDIEVFLFGCPRVGNRAFAKSYDARVFKTFRVSNGNDIVTKLPPFFFGYRHVGIPFPIGTVQLPLAFSFRAHALQEYYKNLLEKL